MDEDTKELVVRLCSRAGMIMEDMSPIALTLRNEDADTLKRSLDQLLLAADLFGILSTQLAAWPAHIKDNHSRADD